MIVIDFASREAREAFAPIGDTLADLSLRGNERSCGSIEQNIV